jgi:hypothetical protein
MSDFWIKWMKASSLVLIAFGFLFALIDLPGIGRPAQLFNDLAFLRLFKGATVPMTPDLAAANGVLGAVMIGWGVFLFLTVDRLVRQDAEGLLRVVAITFTIWYVFDQAASWRAGAYGNMVTNTGFYLMFLAPFLAERWAPVPPAHLSK